MAKKTESLPEWDDGRTIVSMDVEGMPWNNRPSYLKKAISHFHEKEQKAPPDEMTAKQMRAFTLGAVKAGLLVVGILSAGIVLVILFCQNVWFK